MTLQIKQHLFYETSHSPSLVDLVGFEQAQQIIDFCFIANPYYPTPEMVADLAARLPTLIKSYPSSNAAHNAEPLAEVLGVDPGRLIIGNGATELITAMCDRFITSIGVPIPTFSEYTDKIDPAKVALYPLNSADNYRLDLVHYGAWLTAQGARAALVINPANPTGQTFSLEEMHRFLVSAAGLDLVIVDESFIDFAGESIPSLLHTAERFPNLVIVRSMSKHCGVPGLRLGYCYSGNTALLTGLRTALPTWNINTLAEYYLSLLPATDAEYHAARRKVIADVRWLYDQVRRVAGFYPYPSGANFVLIRVENGMTARALQMRLLREHRLYVRDCTNKRGMDAFHVRVATQGRDRDRLLVAALRSLVGAGELTA